MNASDPSLRRLFNAQEYEARELIEDDLPELQAFFAANPEYFLAVNGTLPRPDARGASWLRLGAVAGNIKAERFWEKVGYKEVRRREGMKLGRMTHTLRVFVKPLGTPGLDEYLRLVARDRPESWHGSTIKWRQQ
jgi:hypothetical protein